MISGIDCYMDHFAYNCIQVILFGYEHGAKAI